MTIEEEVRQVLIAARVANDNRSEFKQQNTRRSVGRGRKLPRRSSRRRQPGARSSRPQTTKPTLRQYRRIIIVCAIVAIIVAVIHAVVLGISMRSSMNSGFRHGGGAPWQPAAPIEYQGGR